MRKVYHQMILGWMLWHVAVPAFSQNPAVGYLNVKPGTSVEFVSTIGLIADRYGFLVSVGDNRFRYSQPNENPPLFNLIRSNHWTLVIASDPSPEECEFPHSDLGHYGYPGLFLNGDIEPTGEPGERTRRLRETCWIKKPLIPKGEGENPSLQTGRPCSGGSRNTHEIVQSYEIPRLQRGSVTITAKIAAKLQELFGVELSVGTTVTIYERRRVRSYTRTVDCYTCVNGTYRHVGSYVGWVDCYAITYEPSWICKLVRLRLIPLELRCDEIYTETGCRAYGQWCNCPETLDFIDQGERTKCASFTDLLFR